MIRGATDLVGFAVCLDGEDGGNGNGDGDGDNSEVADEWIGGHGKDSKSSRNNVE